MNTTVPLTPVEQKMVDLLVKFRDENYEIGRANGRAEMQAEIDALYKIVSGGWTEMHRLYGQLQENMAENVKLRTQLDALKNQEPVFPSVAKDKP